MEKILESLAGTAPSSVAVIIVVILFLKHLATRDEVLKQLHLEHEEARKSSRAAIERNSEVIGSHLELSREISGVLKDVSMNMRSCAMIQNEIRERKMG
jgi:hypothetical protein